MNLPSLALRLATVFALRGRTWAGDAVFDSPVDPVSLLANRTQPVIAVYTGADHVKVTGRDMQGGDRSLDLIIQVYLPSSVTVPGEQALDVTRGGAGEMAINLIGCQISDALLVHDGDWSKIWRDIVFQVHETVSEPYLIEMKTGLQIVAREVLIKLETLASPVPAEQPEGVWARLLTALAGEPECAGIAPLVQAALTAGSPLPVWEQARVALGLREAVNMGLTPTVLSENGDPVALGSIAIEDLMPGEVLIEPEA